jgi:hypothetical protein
MTDPQYRFNEVLMEIASHMMATIDQSAYAQGGWTEAFLDARFDPEGAACIRKFRVQLPGAKLGALRGSDDVTRLVFELWDLRSQTLANNWYGVKVSVSPDGACRLDVNFDPHCVNDSGFFDD